MDRLSAELLAPHRLNDLYREAEWERLTALAMVRPRRALLPAVGRLLVRAGHRLECVNQPCVAPVPQS